MAQLQEWIRARGKRSTGARLAVLDALQRSGGALSHNELTEQLESQGHQRASIYRNLIDLVELGLVTRFDAGDHTWRYEFTPPDSAPLHPHFLCVECGEVSCIEQLDFQSGKLTSLEPIDSVSEILIKGRCRNCS